MGHFIIGIIAGTLCTISFLPQLFKIIKTRHTKDLSLTMFIIFAIGVFLWLVYGLLIKEWPVIIANAIVFLFAVFIVSMKVKYG